MAVRNTCSFSSYTRLLVAVSARIGVVSAGREVPSDPEDESFRERNVYEDVLGATPCDAT
jgi:hypothetical protein